MATVVASAPPSPSPELVAHIRRCRSTIDAIDAAGGAPPESAEAYSRAVGMIEAAERELDGDDLGFFWLWPLAQVLIAGGAAYTFYRVGTVIDKVADQVADSTRGVVKEIGRTTEVLSTVLAGAAVYFVVQSVIKRGKKGPE